jgi:hypothetical protein
MATQNVDARHSTNNHVGGSQYNIVNNNHFALSSSPTQSTLSPSTPSSPLSFIDAPLDLLSVYFTGRDSELTRIQQVLDVVHGDVPTRCVLHGMHGLGKTQLTLQFAKTSYDQQRYSHVFWISATTIEKSNQGFANILDLVGHPDRLRPGQRARLTATRRWLEDSESIKWLLVLDNVHLSTLESIREHLPRKNQRGHILFTTRTEVVATRLSYAAGKQQEVIELDLPDVRDAANLLLKESKIDNMSATPVTLNKAEAVVKSVGRLPLAISQAASFMSQSHKDLDDILHLVQREHIQVCSDSIFFCTFSRFSKLKDVSLGERFIDLRGKFCCRDICFSAQ